MKSIGTAIASGGTTLSQNPIIKRINQTSAAETLEPKAKTLTLAHASVRDFFLSQRIKNGASAVFIVDLQLANSYITCSCISYIFSALSSMHSLVPDQSHVDAYPLMEYSCKFWYQHTNFVSAENRTTIFVATLKFLLTLSAVSDWIGYSSKVTDWATFYQWNPSTLFIYSLDQGLNRITEVLLGRHPTSFNHIEVTRTWSHVFISDICTPEQLDELIIRPEEAGALLYAAVSSGNEPLVRILMKHKCKLEASFEPDSTALHAAAIHGHMSVVKLLLHAGAYIEARNSELETPLFAVTEMGHVEVVAMLLEYRAAVNVLSLRSWAPLYVAAQRGHLSIVEMLLQNNADTTVEPTPGTMVLLAAAWHGHKEIVELLMKHESQAKGGPGSRWQIDQSLCQQENLELLRFFLDTGDVMQTFNTEGDTLLHTVAEGALRAVIDLLLDRGAEINAKNSFGETPLFSACRQNHIEIVQLLINHGADIEITNKYGETVLAIAADRGFADIVRLLIEKGAMTTDLNIIPFARTGDLDMVRFLLERGAHRQREGYNYKRIALHWAAEYRHFQLVELLAVDQTDLEYEDAFQKTPIYYAAVEGHGNVVDLLVAKGAVLSEDAQPNQNQINMRGWKPR